MTERTRIQRPRKQSATVAAKERAKRDKFQNERPSLSDLVASGEYSEPMPHDEFWDIWKTMEKLKSFRVSSGLSLADMTAQTGIDRAALSRLENGVADNPTINTLSRYAHALGKRVEVRVVDVSDQPVSQPVKRRRTVGKSVK